MTSAFPSDREDKRRALLDAVESIREPLEACSEEGDRLATLPNASVNALYQSGLFKLKLPTVLGGAEADLNTQLDVIEAVSRIDASAGWCMMIGAASLAGLAAFLPDEAITEIFINGRAPKTAGVFTANGQAVPTEGGYMVDGRWSLVLRQRHQTLPVALRRSEGR